VTAAREWWGVRRPVVRAWAVALVVGAAAFLVAEVAYDAIPRPRPLEELSYYPSGRHLKPATLGHAESAADLAWLRAVQYYGEHRATDNRFTRMSHVFDILTTLSPSFEPAYVFGAFALAQEGFAFEEAERLMLKGIEANPRSARLAFELGFLYYVRPGGRSLGLAAQYFEQAAHQPNAPPFAARFAAYARQHSGSLLVAYELWQQVQRHSPNHYLRDVAEREMQKIQQAIREQRADLAVKRLTTPRVILQ
jgi:hypothetical protein